MQRVSQTTMRQAVTNVVTSCDSPLPAGKKYVKIILPTEEFLFVIVEIKWKCQDLMDVICTYLSLNDPELFGLSVFVDDEFHYFDLVSKLSKYAPKGWKSQQTRGLDSSGKPSFTIYFRVQFYVEHHLLIKDKFTRHYYYLQLRENLLKHCQVCTEERCFLLAAFALQADIGNYLLEKHIGNYFDPHEYFPPWVIKKRGLEYIVQNIPSMHQDNRGMTKSEAKTQFIREASCPEASHNLHMYRLKKKKTDSSGNIWLGVCSRGVEVFQDIGEVSKTSVSTFLWPDIGKLQFEKKKFEIRAVGSPESRKLTYYTGSEERSKHLLHLCKAMHQFHLSIQPKLQEQKKLDVDTTKNYQEAYIYSDSLDLEWEQERGSINMSLHDFNSLPKKSKVINDQRISVISNTSSNTTSGIVSDKVHSMDESEDDLDDEIMINSPPNSEIPASHKQMLNTYLRGSGHYFKAVTARSSHTSGVARGFRKMNNSIPTKSSGNSPYQTMTLEPKSSSSATQIEPQPSTLPTAAKKSAATKNDAVNTLEVPVAPSSSSGFSQTAAWSKPLIIQHSIPSVISSSSSSQASDSTIQSQATVVHQVHQILTVESKWDKPTPSHRINKPRAKSVVSGMFETKNSILQNVDGSNWSQHVDTAAVQKAKSTPELSKENENVTCVDTYCKLPQGVHFTSPRLPQIKTNVAHLQNQQTNNLFSCGRNATKIGISSLASRQKIILTTSPSKLLPGKNAILETQGDRALPSDISIEKSNKISQTTMDSRHKYVIIEPPKEPKAAIRINLSNQFVTSSEENLVTYPEKKIDYIIPPPLSINNVSSMQNLNYILPPPLTHVDIETVENDFDYIGAPLPNDSCSTASVNIDFILPTPLIDNIKIDNFTNTIEPPELCNSSFEDNDLDKIPFIPPPPAYSIGYEENIALISSMNDVSEKEASFPEIILPLEQDKKDNGPCLAEIDEKQKRHPNTTRIVFRTRSDELNAHTEAAQLPLLASISRAQSMPGKTKPSIKKTNEHNQYQTRENLTSDNYDCNCGGSSHGIKNHQALHPDIAELRSLSKNLDLPLISALFNDRTLMPLTNSCCQHHSDNPNLEQHKLSGSILDVSPTSVRTSRPFSWHLETQGSSGSENSLTHCDGTLIYKKTPQPSLVHSLNLADRNHYPSNQTLKSSKKFDLKNSWNSEQNIAPVDLNLPQIKNNYLVFKNSIPNKLNSGGHEPSNGKITPKSFKENLHVGVA